MKVWARRIYTWECPECGEQYTSSTPGSFYCPHCWDGLDTLGKLEELHGPDEKQPDWDKIKKLVQRMSGLLDEIEKEIESEESRLFQNCFEDCPLGREE